MTSKNCFSKMLVRDLKERGVWLISSIILFLLIYPVQILMSLDAIASYMKGGRRISKQNYRTVFKSD